TGGSEGSAVVTIRGPLARTSLRLGVLRLPDSRARLAWLLSHLGELPGSGIIYTLTVSAAEDTARLLRDAGHAVRAYTGQTDTSEREQSEGLLKNNEVKALVATSALGMGFDKPDLGFVLHLGAPSSPVAYYQQVGRAGRATENADVLLLPGTEDEAIWHYFATASMPNQVKAESVLRALTENGGAPLSTQALEARVDLRRTPLELLLKVLDVDGAVRRVKGGWVSTGDPWTYDRDRYERIAAARLHEQRAMIEFETTTGCRMEFLQRALDDETAVPCGRCDNCTTPWYPLDVREEAASAAAASLDRVGVILDARAQWPTGVANLGVNATGKIAPGDRLSEGRALARLTDLGWGGALREVFESQAADAPASQAMTAACVRVLAEWKWHERPAAVVTMPSRQHPLLINSVARALSEVGRLPWLGELSPANGGPTGTAGGNSAYRLSNVWDRFEVGPELDAALQPFAGKPLLLIDDVADSRWTLTVAGRLLRRSGASAVLPFTLALRS
ncbi:ATP-dependent DNA helicase RecQ, partial [Cryobacterium roopkundense]